MKRTQTTYMKKAHGFFALRIATALWMSLLLTFSFLPISHIKSVAVAETTQEKLDSAQAQLDDVNKQLEVIQSQVESASEQLAQTSKKVDEVNANIAAEQEKLENKQSALGKRMASKYRSGENGLIDILLSSTNFADLATNWYCMNKIMQSDADLIEEVKSVKASLNSQKEQLEQLQATQQQEVSNLSTKQSEIANLITSLSDDVKNLMAQRDAELVAAAEAAKQAAQNSGGGTVSPGTPRPPHADTSKGQAIVDACYRTPSTGQGYCAAWVTNVYRNAGLTPPMGNANDMYWAYCHSSDRSQLQAGMIIADPSHPGTGSPGVTWGHVGIYIGGGMVMSNIGSIHVQSLDSFISFYGKWYTVKWGWG